MTVAISLSAETERRLSTQARREGVDLATLAARLLEEEAKRLAADAPAPRPNQATLDLLAQWDQEDQTNDPQEIARRERELREFMEGMNRARLESEGPGARTIYP